MPDEFSVVLNRRRKQLPSGQKSKIRWIQPKPSVTLRTKKILYYNNFTIREGPAPVTPGSFYLTDLKLDGLVTVRYTDTGIDANPETRDPGLRLHVLGPDRKPSFALLAKLGCVLDPGEGPDANAFCVMRRPDTWLPPSDKCQRYLAPGAGLYTYFGVRLLATPDRRGLGLRQQIYVWHLKSGTPPPKLVSSSVIRRIRQEIRAAHTPQPLQVSELLTCLENILNTI